MGSDNPYIFAVGLFFLAFILTQLVVNILSISEMLLKYVTPTPTEADMRLMQARKRSHKPLRGTVADQTLPIEPVHAHVDGAPHLHGNTKANRLHKTDPSRLKKRRKRLRSSSRQHAVLAEPLNHLEPINHVNDDDELYTVDPPRQPGLIATPLPPIVEEDEIRDYDDHPDNVVDNHYDHTNPRLKHPADSKGWATNSGNMRSGNSGVAFFSYI